MLFLMDSNALCNHKRGQSLSEGPVDWIKVTLLSIKIDHASTHLFLSFLPAKFITNCREHPCQIHKAQTTKLLLSPLQLSPLQEKTNQMCLRKHRQPKVE